MSTWHQDQNPRPLWHVTKWTVVDDVYGRSTCVTRWNTQAEADHYAKVAGGYVLAPAPGGSTT